MKLRTWVWVAAIALVAGLVGCRGMGNIGVTRGGSMATDRSAVVPVRATQVDGLETRTINVGGLDRTYSLYVPKNLRGTQAPLVIAFHGGGGNALPFASRIGAREMADRDGFVLALPEGVQESWNTGSIDPQGYAEENGIDDLAFVAQMLDDILAEGIADSSKVYAMGMSRGGMMVYTVACGLPGRFAAIAAVAGTLSSGTCANPEGVSLLHIHGTEDDRVPFEGGHGKSTPRGQEWASARAGILTFAQNAQCSPDWQSQQVTPDTLCNRAACPGSDEVEYCLIEGGGHGWPGAETTRRQRAQGASSSSSFNATDYIAAFFLEH